MHDKIAYAEEQERFTFYLVETFRFSVEYKSAENDFRRLSIFLACRPTAFEFLRTNTGLDSYRVGQKVGHRLITIILSNLNRFKKNHRKSLGKFVVSWILKIPPHLAYRLLYYLEKH